MRKCVPASENEQGQFDFQTINNLAEMLKVIHSNRGLQGVVSVHPQGVFETSARKKKHC